MKTVASQNATYTYGSWKLTKRGTSETVFSLLFALQKKSKDIFGGGDGNVSDIKNNCLRLRAAVTMVSAVWMLKESGDGKQSCQYD